LELIFAFLGVIVGLIIFYYRDIKTGKVSWIQTKEMREEKARIGYLVKGYFFHFSGLPLAQKICCAVYYCADKIIIWGSGVTFTLDFSKIYDMVLLKDTEVQNSVYNGLFFGGNGVSLGTGIISNKSVTKYLIITYEKDGAPSYISFYVEKYDPNAIKMMTLFNKRRPYGTANKTVNL